MDKVGESDETSMPQKMEARRWLVTWTDGPFGWSDRKVDVFKEALVENVANISATTEPIASLRQ